MIWTISPNNSASTFLTTRCRALRKLVVGNRDYRIVYRCLDDNQIAVVLVVARRADNEVYELAVSRLRMHNDPEMRQLAENLRDFTP